MVGVFIPMYIVYIIHFSSSFDILSLRQYLFFCLFLAWTPWDYIQSFVFSGFLIEIEKALFRDEPSLLVIMIFFIDIVHLFLTNIFRIWLRNGWICVEWLLFPGGNSGKCKTESGISFEEFGMG